MRTPAMAAAFALLAFATFVALERLVLRHQVDNLHVRRTSTDEENPARRSTTDSAARVDSMCGRSARPFEVVDDHAPDPADPIFFLLVDAGEIVREHGDNDGSRRRVDDADVVGVPRRVVACLVADRMFDELRQAALT